MNKSFSQYKDAFITEARSLLENMNDALLKLEKSPDNGQFLHEIFRAIHTLKSMAAAMEYEHMVKFCHGIEDLLEAIKNKTIALKDVVDVLFSSFDFLTQGLKNIENNIDNELDYSVIQKKISNYLKQTSTTLKIGKPESSNIFVDSNFEKVKSIEVKVERLDSLLKLVETLLVNKMKLELIRNSSDNPELSTVVENMGRTISDLQYQVMQVRMVSLAFIFNQFPRMVRDLATQQGKKINLIIEGSNIELDRSIIDEISESLIHLLRNAVDHGIETPEERKRANKSPIAELRINAIRSKESVIIEVSDNGRGLDVAQIKAAGIERGVLTRQDQELKIKNSIFSGVSTSTKVTKISGRGLGLSIVKAENRIH